MITRIVKGTIVRKSQIVPGELWIENGRIISAQQRADQEIDAKGYIVAPGYIDLQVNGGFGLDLNSNIHFAPAIAEKLPQFGVTAFLATIISSPRSYYLKSLSQVSSLKSKEGASILGIHLEGPFIHPNKCGAHEITSIVNPNQWSDPTAFYGNIEKVKLVTLAPELEGADRLIEALKRREVVVAAGHTEATYEQMEKAIEDGVSMVTHLFNAMRPFHHRDPGVIGAALTHEHLYYSLIADGVHLHSATLNLAWQANRKGAVLVSDMTAAAGLEKGDFLLGDQGIERQEQSVYVKGTKTLAGSVCSLDVAVRNFWRAVKCSAGEAIELATWRPAKILAIENSKGTLDIGADADFNLLDHNLHVKACFIAGQLAWKANDVQLL